MSQRDRLIELISEYNEQWKHGEGNWKSGLADHLIANGVMIPHIEKGTILVVYRPNGSNEALVATEKNTLRLLTTDELKRESNAKTAIWGKFKPKTIDEYYPEIMRHFTEVE